MQHHGGRTAGDDANGFDDASSIDEDDVGDDNTIAINNIGWTARTARTAWYRKYSDGKEDATDDDDTPASFDGINKRSFSCEGVEDGVESAVATMPCQPGHDAPGTNKHMHNEEDGDNKDNVNDDGAAASNVLSGGRKCEGGDDDADGAPVHCLPAVGTRAGQAEKDVVTGSKIINNNQLVRRGVATGQHAGSCRMPVAACATVAQTQSPS